ncbi:MAG TPA: sensor histidine kinase [Streptosporangiaceae bacterium]|nr:sensor histidine kinase [Streptosporangiaceae bacterium]
MSGRDEGPTTLRPPLTARLTGRQWLVVDSVVAVLAAGIVWVSVGRHGVHYHAPPPGAALFAVLATAPAAVRRIWPVPVFAVVLVASSVVTAVGRGTAVMDVTLCMAVYTVTVRNRRPAALAILVLTEVSLGAGLLFYLAGDRMLVDKVHSLLAAGAIWFVADSVRERRRYLAGLAEQAAQRQQAEAERNQQAVREERVRIARELHDVVAHSLGVVTVQAGVGRRIGVTDPEAALRALRAVEVTGRSALEELRRILGLLRDDTQRPSLAPAPGLGDLGELAEVVRAAGTPVSVAVAGDVTALSPAAALTVYRIIQEALTNVVKHAGAGAASVRVVAGPDGVRIAVTNDGPSRAPAAAAAGRHGIVGMRERAAAFGGTLEAVPLPSGGFQVTAFLPVHGEPPAQPLAPAPPGPRPRPAAGRMV